jgi:hypothetical protein
VVQAEIQQAQQIPVDQAAGPAVQAVQQLVQLAL